MQERITESSSISKDSVSWQVRPRSSNLANLKTVGDDGAHTTSPPVLRCVQFGDKLGRFCATHKRRVKRRLSVSR